MRCGLHRGAVERRDNDYFGPPVNRTARIMSAAHGGQILLSQAVVDSLGSRLPADVTLRDLGSVRLKDLAAPEHVYQIVHPQLRQDFPALRSLEATPNNLPQQLTSFVGREREIAEAEAALEEHAPADACSAWAGSARRGCRCRSPPTRSTPIRTASGSSTWRRSGIRSLVPSEAAQDAGRRRRSREGRSRRRSARTSSRAGC